MFKSKTHTTQVWILKPVIRISNANKRESRKSTRSKLENLAFLTNSGRRAEKEKIREFWRGENLRDSLSLSAFEQKKSAQKKRHF